MRFIGLSAADYITGSPGGPVIVGLKRQLNILPVHLGQPFTLQLWLEYALEEADLHPAEGTIEVAVSLEGDALTERVDYKANVPDGVPPNVPVAYWNIQRYMGFAIPITFTLKQPGELYIVATRAGTEDHRLSLPVVLLPEQPPAGP